MNQTIYNNDMVEYYNSRAPEYETIYNKPERQGGIVLKQLI